MPDFQVTVVVTDSVGAVWEDSEGEDLQYAERMGRDDAGHRDEKGALIVVCHIHSRHHGHVGIPPPPCVCVYVYA